ncbi:MAG: hypothetical protein ACK47B_05260 [Armatimonadota bacterium]
MLPANYQSGSQGNPTPKARHTLVCAIALWGALLTSVATAADPAGRGGSEPGNAGFYSQTAAAPAKASDRFTPAGNGISIGQIKLYDERALRVMLRQAEASLAALRVYQQDTLTGALGRTQGVTVDERTLALQVMQPPLAGADGAAPNPVPAPAVAPSTLSATGTVGIGSQDLLMEQEALNYQITNLRLLLQGAISDRVARTTSGPSRTESARFQAILGFQISIDTPERYKNRVAEVEVTLPSPSKTARSEGQDRVQIASLAAPPISERTLHDDWSLVSLLPKEKTYNVAALRRDATSIGFGVVTNVISLGGQGGRARETLYLVKDTDTVALERSTPSGKGEPLKFAWQFRPTLGRSAVEPGIRQVYVVLSIPDKGEDYHYYETLADIRTYWREFKRKTGIVGDEIISSGGAETQRSVSVPGIAKSDELLEPRKLRVAQIQDLGTGHIRVTVDGENLIPETRVLLGGTALSPDQVTFQGDRRIIFVAPNPMIASGDVHLVGPYGKPVRVERKETDLASFTVDLPEVTQLDSERCELEIGVRVPSGKVDEIMDDLIVDLGRGNPYGFRDRPIRRRSAGKDGLPDILLTLHVPTTVLRSVDEIRVLRPLSPTTRVATEKLNMGPIFSVSRVTTRPSSTGGKYFWVDGVNFTEWMYYQGKKEPIKATTELPKGEGETKPRLTLLHKGQLLLFLPAEEHKGIDQLVFIQEKDKKRSTVIAPLVPPPGPLPTVNALPAVRVNESKEIEVRGEHLDSIAAVKFENLDLVFQIAPDGKSMKVRIPSELTKTASPRRQIDFITKDGKKVSRDLEVNS